MAALGRKFSAPPPKSKSTPSQLVHLSVRQDYQSTDAGYGRVVGTNTVQELLNDRAVLRSLTRVSANGSWSGIRDVGLRNCPSDSSLDITDQSPTDSDLASGDSSEHLEDGLDFRVTKGLASGAGMVSVALPPRRGLLTRCTH